MFGAIGAAAVAACSDSNQPRYHAPGVDVSMTPTFLGPRDVGTITMTVTPTHGDPVASAWLILDAGAGDRDSVAFPLDGTSNPQTASLDLTVPDQAISAQVLAIGRATSRSRQVAEDTVHFTIGDTTPPAVRWIYVDDTVHAGQTASIGADYSDRSGLAQEELHLTGAITRDEVNPDTYHSVQRSIAFTVAVPALPGDSIVQRAVATDIYGLKTEIRQVYHIAP